MLRTAHGSRWLPYGQLGGVRVVDGPVWGKLLISDREGHVLQISGLTRGELSDTVARLSQLPSVQAVSDAFEMLMGGGYVTATRMEEWCEEARAALATVDQMAAELGNGLPAGIVEHIDTLRMRLTDAEWLRQDHNTRHIDRLRAQHGGWLNGVLGHMPTNEQEEAIYHDDTNTLLLAGAGTGKTAVVVGKVGVLLRSGSARADQILIVSTNRQNANDVRRRLRRNDLSVPTLTFHRLCMDIVAAVEGHQPALSRIATDAKLRKSRLITILEQMLGEVGFRAEVLRFLLFSLRPYRAPHRFASREDYQQHLRGFDMRTLRGERVHSCEACIIANWLHCHNITYTYRPALPRSSGPTVRSDFFLPDHDLYIDITVLDEDGQLPSFVDPAAYFRREEQRRSVHTWMGHNVIEIRSADLTANRLGRTLLGGLRAAGVPIRALTGEALLGVLNEREEIKHLAKLIGPFIHHIKSTGGIDDELLYAAASVHEEPRRARAFVALLVEVFDLSLIHI